MRLEIMINKDQNISQDIMEALETTLLKHLHPQYPSMAIRIRKGSNNGIELSGLRGEEDRKNVMDIVQAVWEDDSWMH